MNKEDIDALLEEAEKTIKSNNMLILDLADIIGEVGRVSAAAARLHDVLHTLEDNNPTLEDICRKLAKGVSDE